MKISKKWLSLLTIAGCVVGFDQATKLFIHTQFQLGESLVVIKDYFHITYVRNTGAAFGILRQGSLDTTIGFITLTPDIVELLRKAFFMLMPPAAMAIIITLLKSVPSTDRVQVVALSAIFGGALGNYIDRLRFGYVVDFLDFHWQHKYSWPAFNIADSAIVVGASVIGLLILKQMFTDFKAKRATSRSTT